MEEGGRGWKRVGEGGRRWERVVGEEWEKVGECVWGEKRW